MKNNIKNKSILDFESQELKIDYLTFSTTLDFNSKKFIEISNYFFYQHGFNIFVSKGNTRNYIEPILRNQDIKDLIIIRLNYYNRTIIEIPGKYGHKFYKILKSRNLNLKKWLPNPFLTRIDICFDLQYKFINETALDNFLLEARDFILKAPKQRSTKLINEPANSTLILGINKRSNPRYFRIYRRQNKIRFELELKKAAAKSIQNSLLDGEFEVFESNLTMQYFRDTTKIFPFQNDFLIWLHDFNRRHLSKTVLSTKNNLQLEYFYRYTDLDEHQFYHLLQFLNFLKTLKPRTNSFHYLEGKTYWIEEFDLIRFVQFIGLNRTNQYQKEKLIDYFEKLETTKSFVERFTDGGFQIFSTILYSSVTKKSNRWRVRVYVMEELYSYHYPLKLSAQFLNYTNKTDCLLKTEILASLCTNSVKKQFYFFDFFQKIKLSNSKICTIKQKLQRLRDRNYHLFPKV